MGSRLERNRTLSPVDAIDKVARSVEELDRTVAQLAQYHLQHAGILGYEAGIAFELFDTRLNLAGVVEHDFLILVAVGIFDNTGRDRMLDILSLLFVLLFHAK